MEYKNDVVQVSESYCMHLVFSCVTDICDAIDVLILNRASKHKREQSVECNGHRDEDIEHQDKTGLGSESFKHTQPLDIDEDEGKCSQEGRITDSSCDYCKPN